MPVSIVVLKRQQRYAIPRPMDVPRVGPMDVPTVGVPNIANPLGVLVWPLGIAATGFLLTATVTIFIVWMPVIALFWLRRRAVQRREIEVGA
jgi:hypothetical protein